MPTDNVVPTIGLNSPSTPQARINNPSMPDASLMRQVNKTPDFGAFGESMLELASRWQSAHLQDKFNQTKSALDQLSQDFARTSATGSTEDVSKTSKEMDRYIQDFQKELNNAHPSVATQFVTKFNDYTSQVHTNLMNTAAAKVFDYEDKTLSASLLMSIQDTTALLSKLGIDGMNTAEYQSMHGQTVDLAIRQMRMHGVDPNSELGKIMLQEKLSKNYLAAGLNLIAEWRAAGMSGNGFKTSMNMLYRLKDEHNITVEDETTWLNAIGGALTSLKGKHSGSDPKLNKLGPDAQAYALALELVPYYDDYNAKGQANYEASLKEYNQRIANIPKDNPEFFNSLTEEQQKKLLDGDIYSVLTEVQNKYETLSMNEPVQQTVKASDFSNDFVMALAGSAPQMGGAIARDQLSSLAIEQANTKNAELKADYEKRKAEYDKQTAMYEAAISELTSLRNGRPTEFIPKTFDRLLAESRVAIDQAEQTRKQGSDPVYQGLKAMQQLYAQAVNAIEKTSKTVEEREQRIAELDAEPDFAKKLKMWGGDDMTISTIMSAYSSANSEEKPRFLNIGSTVGNRGHSFAVGKSLLNALTPEQLKAIVADPRKFRDWRRASHIDASAEEQLLDSARVMVEENENSQMSAQISEAIRWLDDKAKSIVPSGPDASSKRSGFAMYVALNTTLYARIRDIMRNTTNSPSANVNQILSAKFLSEVDAELAEAFIEYEEQLGE